MAIDTDSLAAFRAYTATDATMSPLTDEYVGTLYDDNRSNLARTILAGWLTIAANAAKFYDYRTGQTSDTPSQVFKNAMTMVEYWEQRVRLSNEVLIAAVSITPPTATETGAGQEHPDQKRRRTDDNSRRRGGRRGGGW